MTNKEECESTENVKRCWICKRSEAESLRDFKNIILEDDKESEIRLPVIPRNVKELIRNDEILPYPKGSDWIQSNIITFEKGWNLNTEKDIEFETDSHMFVNIYLCDVCQPIFNENWESLKEFIFDRLKERGIDLTQ